jgi:hypothetical protein
MEDAGAGEGLFTSSSRKSLVISMRTHTLDMKGRRFEEEEDE